MIDCMTARRQFPAEVAESPSSQTSHILVPVTLSQKDVAAIRLGLQMAAGTRAKVTILRVGPLAAAVPSRNWLDSIDQLHHSLDGAHAFDITTIVQSAADELEAFVRSAGVSTLLAQSDVTLISRPGDFADEVLRFARTQAADVVILPGELLQGWVPVVPSRLRRKLQQLGKRILAVWPEAADRDPVVNHARPAFA